MSRVAVYGWGLVAPGARNLKEFEHHTSAARCGLALDRRLELGSGLFAGHGMSNAAGWELTALAVDMMNGRTSPVGVEAGDIHPALRQEFARKIATDERPLRAPLGVKMMLGIGGITACVMLRLPGDRPAVEDAST